MKLIIQIPCYNEEKYLPIVLKQLPRRVEGCTEVEWLVINDGSVDETVAVAKENGVNHVVSFNKNRGLAKAFMAGLEKCIELGADVIVNIDADNQYNAHDIPKLVEPILSGDADIVVGERPIRDIEHFSFIKKNLQKIGSYFVRKISKTSIPDTTSGFRAISINAAMNINVFNNYTYTLETIIQAGRKNMAIISVPIGVNQKLRPSRLIKSIPAYIVRSLVTMTRIFVVYKPFRFFTSIGVFLFSLGLVLGIRFLVFYFSGQGSGHVQSLILTGIFLGMGFQTMLVAFLADLLAVNRSLSEDIQYKLRQIHFIRSNRRNGI